MTEHLKITTNYQYYKVVAYTVYLGDGYQLINLKHHIDFSLYLRNIHNTKNIKHLMLENIKNTYIRPSNGIVFPNSITRGITAKAQSTMAKKDATS